MILFSHSRHSYLKSKSMDPFHSHSQRGSFSTSFPTSFPNRMGISHSEKFSRNDSNNNFIMNNSSNGNNNGAHQEIACANS